MEESDGSARLGARSPEELAELDRELAEIKRKLSERFDMDMDIGQWIDRRISRRITDDILCALD